jgi:Spy/CpxP family protein refolding chaperone
MNVWKLLVVTMVVWFSFPSDGLAQQHARWWQAERFKQELGLSADQTARLEEVFQGMQPTLSQRKEKLDRLEDELSRVIASNDASETDVMRLAERVEAARGELGKARILMLYRMRQVLTQDQHLRLHKMHQQRERDRRRQPR